jgi:amidase
VALAPSFDTVGLLARELGLLHRAASVLLEPDPATDAPTGAPLGLAEALAVVSEPVRAAVLAAAGGPRVSPLGVDLEGAAGAFRVLQGREAWLEHGAWITATRPTFGPGVRARFDAASRVTDDQVARAREVRAEVRAAVRAATSDGRVLVAPAAPGAAPPLEQSPDEKAVGRSLTLQLTAIAGLAGAPVVVVPRAEIGGLPLGVAAMAAPGTDLGLLAWAAEHLG